MKANRPLAALALALPIAAACNRSIPQPEPSTLALPCTVAVTADAGNNAEISALQHDLRERRTPARTAEHLGYRFISRARLTNDPGYYKVAEQAAACLESFQPGEPSALLLRGHVLHQLHRFTEAEAIARRLVASREFVLDHGLLGDALMEQGRLAEAAEAYQKMINLKPFYQSYTRAAHLRWLRGDLDGAIRMIQSAVKAASPRDPESVAWAYARLATYELQRGRLDEADRMAGASLQSVSEYAPALMVRGRILLARKKDFAAVEVLERAASLNPLPEYQWTLADALRLVRRTDEAAAIEQQLVRDGAAGDPRTLALYLSTRRMGGALAVDLARREMKVRSDIFTLDALAWSLVNVGEVREASTFMEQALAQGTEDGRLFLHASVIAAADGRPADAARWARKAQSLRFTLLPSELGVLRGNVVVPPQA
jgi:tetratricopeptide (TPR) repeat protein